MEIVNRASAFQNYQNFSDVIAKRTKPASENSKPIENEWRKLSDCFGYGYGVIMIMPNEESGWVHQYVRYIHWPALFI